MFDCIIVALFCLFGSAAYNRRVLRSVVPWKERAPYCVSEACCFRLTCSLCSCVQRINFFFFPHLQNHSWWMAFMFTAEWQAASAAPVERSDEAEAQSIIDNADSDSPPLTKIQIFESNLRGKPFWWNSRAKKKYTFHLILPTQLLCFNWAGVKTLLQWNLPYTWFLNIT